MAEALLAAVLTVAVGWNWADALHTYVVTNALIGLTFTLCGAVIARNRPRNPIGWLFVADGVGHATAAVMAPAAQALHDADASIVGQRAAL
ncbi:MAG: two-component sensor histidine kinase, partial [Actinomycetota bacterium]|nr:two-component sensor histidine kinase [Actinomycetota bacterium]